MATSIAAPATLAIPESAASGSGAENPIAHAASGDRGRVWLWYFLAVVAAAQIYFVRELFVAFFFFATAFAAVASVVVAIYMLHKLGELALARLAKVRRPVLAMAAVKTIAGAASVRHEHREAA